MNQALYQTLKDQGIQVLAVSKYHTKEEVDALARAGITVFGENRVQEFLEKYDPNYTWHIIGHLQTNKVKYIIGKVACIQSVDSLRLAQEIEKQAAKQDLVQDILIQIKVSQDEKKTGLPLEEADDLIQAIQGMKHICIKGLMAVASHTEDKEKIETEFEQVHQLYLNLKQKYPTMDTLSMGMSSDYPLAIQHGATMVRLGHALFE